MKLLLSVALLALTASCQSGATYLNLPGRTDTLPYSHVAVAGDTVYVAGTLGLTPDGTAPADPAEEARLAMDGIRAKLALVDLTPDDLVMVQVFCSDPALYDTFNTVYATYFVKNFPTRAFVGSGTLLRGCRFEINGIAVR